MRKLGGILAGVTAVLVAAWAAPASAEQMQLAGYFAAGSDDAAMLRSLAVDDFAGEDGPQLALAVADLLRDVRIDGQPWLQVLAGRFGRDAEAVLGGNVRTRYAESPITLRRNVCVEYDQYDTCLARADQDVPCLRVVVSVRPDLRLTRRGGQLLWSFSQESSRQEEFCPDYDQQPDFTAHIDSMLADHARQVRYALAPAHEWRRVRVMEGRGDLPRSLRDSYRAAIRAVESDPDTACSIFAQLLPQAPQHVQLVHNNALCAERAGDLAAAEATYQQLASGRGAAREGREGLARIAAYRRARAQIERR